MFRLTSRFNEGVRIAAIVQLIAVILNLAVVIGNIEALKLNNVFVYIFTSTLALLMPLYIVSVLCLFDQQRTIVVAFIIFTVVNVLMTSTAVIAFFVSTRYSFLFPIWGLSGAFASVFIFITSLVIKNKIIMGPIILFTTEQFVFMLINVLVPIIFPLVNYSNGINEMMTM